VTHDPLARLAVDDLAGNRAIGGGSYRRQEREDAQRIGEIILETEEVPDDVRPLGRSADGNHRALVRGVPIVGRGRRRRSDPRNRPGRGSHPPRRTGDAAGSRAQRPGRHRDLRRLRWRFELSLRVENQHRREGRAPKSRCADDRLAR
jgi:hypothetical protein